MQSNNPVFRRSEEFNRPARNAYGNQTYAGNGAAYPGYGHGPRRPGAPARPARPPRHRPRPDDHRLGRPEDRDLARRRDRRGRWRPGS